MPELLLGPILRHVAATDATIWLETDQPCEVAILGRKSRTFSVEGHHYALVILKDLSPGTHAYEVTLDGCPVWPERLSDAPPSAIRTLDESEVNLVFGSCRVTAPHEGPAALPRDENPHGRGVDALRALARRMMRSAPASWPQCLLLLGDQVYADEVSPQTRRFIESRRDTSAPHRDEIADFEEYTHLYREAWREPAVRWLLSNVGTTMLWDDHDVHDDWNISKAWLEQARAEPWWRERITGAIMSYWLYQHIGNLSPSALESDALLADVRRTDDAGPVLRAFASRIAETGINPRWSIRRDFGRTRLVGLDCRAGRVLTPGARSMLSEADWRWLAEQAHGACDHLLIAVSTPYLLTPALHCLESWSEAVCDGAWGRLMAALGERLRQALDLDHWAAFRRSFDQLTDLLYTVSAGEASKVPTIVVLAGDIHNGSISRVSFPGRARAGSRVYQIVSSPLRNHLGRGPRLVLRIAESAAAAWVGRALLVSVGLKRPAIRWSKLAGQWFGNHVSTIQLRGAEATVRVELAVSAQASDAELKLLLDMRL